VTQQLELFSQARPAPAPALAPSTSHIELRPYQIECLEEINRLREEGENRLIAQMATGAGKTILFSALTMQENVPTLILAHRDELLSQAIAKLRKVWPEADIGRVQAERNEVGHQVTVSSVQTLYREKRFNEAFPDPARVGLVITDESHHSYASTYKMIYERLGIMARSNPGAPLHLGVTATPIRGDKKTLGDVFDRFAFKWGILDGIRQGYLCDLSGYALQFSNEAFGDVHIKNGDYDEGELEEAVLNVARSEAIVECWKEQAQLSEGTYRRTIAFCVSIKHAKQLCDTFRRYGIKAGVIYSGLEYDQRQKVLADLEDGKIDVVCNCMILTEGFDLPAISCVIMARPTRNKSLYIQCAGRGTRLFPEGGKTNCLIIDVADVSSKMSLHFKPQTLDKALDLVPEGKEQKEVQSVLKLIMAKDGAGDDGKELKFREAGSGKEFNPFSDPFENASGINLRWSVGASGLTLALPQRNKESKHYLIIKRRKDWLWDVLHLRRVKQENRAGFEQWVDAGEKFVNSYGLPDQAAAAQFAEKYALDICPEAGWQRKRDASWLREEQVASPAQLNFLKTKGLPLEINGKVVTKGQASALLDTALAKRVKSKLERRVDDLDIY
jgi:superfamily II DNA or RNA helicase